MKTAMAKKKTAAARSKRVLGWKGRAVKGHGPVWKRGAASDLKVAAADFERPVIYRGIKIEPIAGRRSSLARAIRDDLRKQSEQSRGKSA
jgi:hypothetical protein